MEKRTIVISAVNLVEAGTLAILRECLCYLSILAAKEEYRVIAIVYKKELVDFPNIEYRETQWPKKRWLNRLWYEYITMNIISKELKPVFLWFSLHDTSPSVQAERRAVYCHNSYFTYRWKLHDLIFAPKIALFAIFTKRIYKTNIKRNDYLVVQQNWFRTAMHNIFDIDESRIIVARPESPVSRAEHCLRTAVQTKCYTFIFAGSPNSHKNFEVICEAVSLLEKQVHIGKFKVFITVKGDENKYAKWLWKHWGSLKAIDFVGFLPYTELNQLYEESNCLIFPSKVESWGLPISEFAQFGRPMLLADLPYAHETAVGSLLTAFFDPNNACQLAEMMKNLIEGDTSILAEIPIKTIRAPTVNNWGDLFTKLLT